MRIISRKVASSDGQEATLTGYVIDNSPEMHMDRVRPTILLMPGGGYVMTSDIEAEPVALKMVGYGYNVFVLRYSCAPAHYPVAMEQAAESIRLMRESAREWNIDPHAIIAAGFSAGGHVAASLGTLWNKGRLSAAGFDPAEIRPDGLFLGYSVLTSGEFAHRDSIDNLLGDKRSDEAALHEVSLELQVDEHTPPAFMWHTVTDGAVPVENTMLFALALKNHQVPVEVHLFQQGAHGLSLGTEETTRSDGSGEEESVQSWPALFNKWVQRNFAKKK